jgi:hypothetical protein
MSSMRKLDMDMEGWAGRSSFNKTAAAVTSMDKGLEAMSRGGWWAGGVSYPIFSTWR